MIHKYKLNGYNIVLDVNSGGVHVVDELTYDMLDNVSPPFEDICPGKTVFPPMYKSNEDREFAFRLLRASIENHDQYRKLIEGYIDNWDIERVALIDNLIMQMAINELIEFRSIPVRVTFDEYLELAKYYSTSKSSVFINGLLDKISADLTEKGVIIKTGKGLMTE